MTEEKRREAIVLDQMLSVTENKEDRTQSAWDDLQTGGALGKTYEAEREKDDPGVNRKRATGLGQEMDR